MKIVTGKIICVLILSVIGAVILIHASTADDFKYDNHGKRDPFASLIDQEKNSAGKLIDITSPEDLRLEGVALGGAGKKTAIINGEIVKEGQKIGVIEIKKITSGGVELLVSGKPYSLNLPEDGGSKSEQ